MKKQLIALVSIILSASAVQAQQPITDTLAYLTTQVQARKSLYIGQPFSKLLTDLSIQPQSLSGLPTANNRHIEMYTKFYYAGPDAVSINTHYIYITWQTPLPRAVTRTLIRDNDWLFNDKVRNYYSDKIVKDIFVH